MSIDSKIKSSSEWDDLREILTGEERRTIEGILQRLDDDKIHASEISRILPEALRLSAKHGHRLNEVLIPIIELTLRESIKRQPNILVDALYSLIGPAARKAVYESMKGLMQAFNIAMESVFTIQGIKWRIEAISAGKSYAEVVLINSIVFQVEQVFLIHKETGLLLQHVRTSDAIVQNEDMVSSMLKALQDFAHDSFNLKDDEVLNNLDVGEMTVWVEQSPHAILAAVIRGNVPESFRETLSSVLELIHKDYYQDLSEFEGDVDVFVPVAGELEKCLQTQVKSPKKKTPVLSWLVFGFVSLILLSFSIWQINTSIKWSDYIDWVKNEPGLVLLEEDSGIFSDEITGLKDPLANSPVENLEQFGILSDRVNHRWQEFVSLEPDMMIKKAEILLEKPESVEFEYSSGTLIAKGIANSSWINNAKIKQRDIAGVDRMDFSNLKVTEDELLKQTIHDIEEIDILFEKNSTKFSSGEKANLAVLIDKINKLSDLSDKDHLEIEIWGHTDQSGDQRLNEKLSYKRAKAIKEYLSFASIKNIRFIAKGVGGTAPAGSEVTENDKEKNRRVNLKIKK
jgi:outer membrane protein OmpA-like peptidoglycan-associated protein